MDRDKFLSKLKELMRRYGKIAIPVIVALLATVAVVLGLKLGRDKGNTDNPLPDDTVVADPVNVTPPDELEIPLTVNNDDGIDQLIKQYYGYLSSGDEEGLKSLCNTFDETSILWYAELSKYITYEVKDIYVQPGPAENMKIVYVYSYAMLDQYPDTPLPYFTTYDVRADEDGKYYIDKSSLNDDEKTYYDAAIGKSDVQELINRTDVEYNDIVDANPELLTYLDDVDAAVYLATAEKIAEKNGTDKEEEKDPDEDEGKKDGIEMQSTEDKIIYARATTMLNVRESDSLNAQRVTQLYQGQKVKVVKVQINGWTQVEVENTTGFVKSEYLSIIEDASNYQSIGTVKAKETVNVRMTPSTADSSNIMGQLYQGTEVDYIAIEDDWTRIKYNDQLGYVKSEYLE